MHNDTTPKDTAANSVGKVLSAIGEQVQSQHPPENVIPVAFVGTGPGQGTGPAGGSGSYQEPRLADRKILGAAVKVLDNLTLYPIRGLARKVRTPQECEELLKALTATQGDIEAVVEPLLAVLDQFNVNVRQLPLLALGLALANLWIPKQVALADLRDEAQRRTVTAQEERQAA